MPDDDVNRSSPEFLFGRILAEMGALKDQVAKLTSALQNLPDTNPVCQQRVGRLEVIETWKGTVEKDNRFRSQAGLKLWHGILLVGAAGAVNLLATLLVLWAQQ